MILMQDKKSNFTKREYKLNLHLRAYKKSSEEKIERSLAFKYNLVWGKRSNEKTLLANVKSICR